jgi:NADH dehydrogenase
MASNNSVTDKPRIVIVGAGFGGLWAARALARQNVDVTLIDRNNYHSFLPLLYQVAAAEIEAEQIAYPVRSILRGIPNVHFIMAEVERVDWQAQVVHTGERSLPYDTLVLAMGSKAHYFGVPGAADYTFPLKTIREGLLLRNHILRCFEQAVVETDPERRRQLLTFAIVGGGPTGVEYAGALRELIRRPLARDFPSLDMDEVRVILIEAREDLISFMSDKLSQYTAERLKKMGVELWLNTMVEAVQLNGVQIADGAFLPSATVVWTAGVQGESLPQQWTLPLARGGRVAIEPTLQVPGMENVYVVGDMAYLEQDGAPLPQLAQPAMQQGEWVARNVMRQLQGEPTQPFRYKDRGAMATIGRNAAVAQIGRFAFRGFFAWLMWLFIHLAYLIGFRNRLVVLINWAWDYFFFERIARLILDAEDTHLTLQARAAPPQ